MYTKIRNKFNTHYIYKRLFEMRNSVFNVQSVLQFSVKTREYFQFTDFGAMLYNYYSK